MKKLCLPRGKKRNLLTLLLCVGLAVLLLALNLFLPYVLGEAAVYVDLTREGLYTLTDAFVKEVADIKQDVEIVFLADKDYLLGNYETRYVYIMCQKLEKVNDRISIRHIDLAKDPHAADAFRTTKATELLWNDVIVNSGGRFKVLNATAFFTSENDVYVSFNGEYRLATAILSVTRYPDGPYAYFATGHGEKYYVEGDEGSYGELSLFAEMLGDLGLRVGKLSLDQVSEIPDDCVLLIFYETETDYASGDKMDFYASSAIAKLDAYLAKDKSMMVFRGALAEPLPIFDEYLAEWGFAFDGTRVDSPEESLISSSGGSGNRLVATYPDAETAAVGYSIFSDLLNLATPPKTVLENATSLRGTWKGETVICGENVTRYASAAFYAGEKAKIYDKNGYIVDRSSPIWLGAISSEAELSGGEYQYTYVFASGSPHMITNAYLGDTSLGNGDVVFALLRTISRTDVFASGEIGGFDLNKNYGGKMFDELHLSADEVNEVWFGLEYYEYYKGMTTGSMVFMHIAVLGLPLLVLPVAGFYVLRRRKNPLVADTAPKDKPKDGGKTKAAPRGKEKK